MITFIIGGIKSGKTRFALKEGENTGNKNFYYIATAKPIDKEMKERIEKHKKERGSHWITIEEPVTLGEVLIKIPDNSSVVIDCLTTWLTNLIVEGHDHQFFVDSLIDSLKKVSQRINLFIVANEVGLGIIPESELARKFIDIAGVVNQRIMDLCDKAYFMVAGRGIRIK
ncbi:adenosylcobinamide kinase [Thermodesulfovibrio aggregans]|uniref:Adenosylcobinamide kinase n=1 Tax=Thermodesulfovibrio aggregans TaxID=86166 RepID=A0A0U9HQU2_9BACT|nr:bifunctional adenosylcobinamide kinase/adenosylcobinamide-phosphate guanylyltransferase [Thermodesulfovibrio aggregans]GAQ95415.1 adenosylcobinamide kinase [Thermodesulfovibrio aggregans]